MTRLLPLLLLHRRAIALSSFGWRFKWHYIWLLAVILTGNTKSWAQQPATTGLLPPYFIPKSPTVTAFQRFDTQQLVNLPTGGAQLSVPLAELRSGSLTLPVSLAYSFTGLQVYQPWDLVGLGWSLQAGTSISLQVNGLLDSNTPFASTRYTPDSLVYPTQSYLRRINERDVDSGPDLYSFSLPSGVSGRFLLRDTTVVLVPAQPVHIRLVYGQPTLWFQVTTEDGIRYQFQASEQTNAGQNKFGIGNYLSAWHLTRIISADNADTLRLHYSLQPNYVAATRFAVTTGQYVSDHYSNIGNTIDIGGVCGDAGYSTSNSLVGGTSHSAQFLDSITVRGAHLVFTRQAGTHLLQGLRLVATTGGRQEIKRVQLFQSAFSGFGTAVAGGDVRVRLDSLRESANGRSLPAYRFAYIDATMPPRSSAAQDYWGYYNGALNNGDVQHLGGPGLLADPLLGARKAQRDPVFSYAVAGALVQVTYPTGGYSRWDYESGHIGYEIPPIISTTRDTLFFQTGIDYSMKAPHLAPQAPKPVNSSVVYSGQIPFDLVEAGVIKLNLVRSIISGGDTTRRNKFRDFNLWKREPNGDSTLITNGLIEGAYRSDNGFRRFYLRQPSGQDLVPGQYAIEFYCEPDERCMADIFVPHLSSSAATSLEGPMGEGVRVQRTETVAVGAPALIRTYEYVVPDAAGAYGSGLQLTSDTKYREQAFITLHFEGECGYIQTSSDGSKPGDELSKYPFYYRCVTVREGPQQGATTTYFQPLGHLFNDVVPLKKQVYRQAPQPAGQLQLVEQEEYVYHTDDSLLVLPIVRVNQTQQLLGNAVTFKGNEYAAEYFILSVGYTPTLPAITRQIHYEGAGIAYTTLTYSQYYHQRVVSTGIRTSTSWRVQRYKRLSEYAPSAVAASLRTNYFNPIIETQTWQHPIGSQDSTLVGGQLTLYHPLWHSPASTYQLRLDRPQPGLNRESKVNGHYTSMRSDTRYEQVDTVRYAAGSGDLIQHQPTHGRPTSYLLGYDRTLVIAEAKNAAFAQLAYTSFEPLATGRWAYDSTGTHRVLGGRTGRWAYQLDGAANITRGQLPAGDYELTYWTQGTSSLSIMVQGGSLLSGGPQLVATTPTNWYQYRTRLHCSALGHVSLNTAPGAPAVRLDEVRLYPVGAQLTSYTHDPLVGITSQTDPTGRLVTYEYDALGRLVRTRDEQGRILSQQQYHYAQH